MRVHLDWGEPLEVALEALDEGLRDRVTTVTQIADAARAVRAWTVIRPYLESMAR